MNYRKFYCTQTNHEIPDDFHIHHLDGNRKNNNITNLVAIPKNLHMNYHTILYKIEYKIDMDFNGLVGYKRIKSEIITIGASQCCGYQRTLITSLYNNICKLRKLEDCIIDYIKIRNKQCGITLQEELDEVFKNVYTL